MQNWERFYASSEFDREYSLSRTSQDIQNRKDTIPPAFSKKSLVNFGPPSRTCKFGIHPNGLFSEDYDMSPLWECWPLKFLYALEIGQGLLAHTTKGDVGPPKKF